MPLKNIPFLVSPDLLKVLCEMGHGDTIVFADAHFPTSSLCQQSGAKEIRMDGHCIPQILHAVLELFPLDSYVLAPVTLMQVVDTDIGKVTPTIWDAYKEIIRRFEPAAGVQMLDRFAFYDAAKNAYSIVHTGETSQYGNVILKKGVVHPKSASSNDDRFKLKQEKDRSSQDGRRDGKHPRKRRSSDSD